MDRRDFIKKATITAAGAAVVSPVSAILHSTEAGKTPKVLLVNGSPRTDGNTFCCLKEIEATLNKHGVESEIVQIGRKPVRMCINCGGCQQNNGAGCAFDDDMCSVMTVVRSYQALGRLYRGIICSTLRQYAMLGDAAAMTDGVASDDDRWIFTEDNPMRALSTAAQLAGAARVLRGFNDLLAQECLDIAAELYRQTQVNDRMAGMRLQAAVELYLTTGEADYLDFILAQQDAIVKNIARTGWFTARVAKQLEAKSRAKGIGSRDRKAYRTFAAAFRTVLADYKAQLDRQAAETPYGVPYRPSIWGAGWDIQRFGFEYYFLTHAYPDIFPKETVYNALNFVLGCHPGSNTASFASGVGARSATVAYGLNRADWSYIPGGVVSGTALIRPDFPELLEFPFLWQQTEYVLGGGSSHYMFLVLAANSK